MASALESLPIELLDQVLDALGHSNFAALTRLLRCSKHLRQRMEPALYDRKEVLNKATRWACVHGSTQTIRLVISYGADVSTVEAAPYPGSEKYWAQSDTGADRAPPRVMTLYLAAKNGQTDVCRTLLELGTRLDDVGIHPRLYRQQLRHFVKRVFSASGLKTNPDLVRLLIEADIISRAGTVGPGSGIRELRQPLVKLIESGASPELIQLLLDKGADPNQVDPHGDQESLSALTAAILANSPSIFRLLVERGADIRGPQLAKAQPTQKALHLPAFAAAHVLAIASHGPFTDTNWGISMLQMCLGCGADINQRAPVAGTYHSPYFPRRLLYDGWYYNATPLYAFLLSISAWDSAGGPDPVKGLTYLLEHGACVDSPGETRDADPRPERWRKDHLRIISSIELLLDKWKPAALAHASCMAVFRLLLEHGAARNDHAYLLVKYTISNLPNGSHPMSTSTLESMVDGRHDLAMLLAEDVPPTEASDTLARYILALGTSASPLGEISAAVVDKLIAQGADINANIVRLTYGTEHVPALHELCREFNDMQRNMWSLVDGLDERNPKRRQALLRFLISRGADPNIVVGGKTAFDRLLHNLDEGKEDKKEYLSSLATILRGEDNGRVMVYQPTRGWKRI